MLALSDFSSQAISVDIKFVIETLITKYSYIKSGTHISMSMTRKVYSII